MFLSSGSQRRRVARRHHFGVVNRRSGTRNRHAVVLYISASAVAYMPFRWYEYHTFGIWIAVPVTLLSSRELGPVNYLVVLVWLVVRHLDVVLLREHLLSLPRSCVYLVGLLASQWFRPSVLLLRGGGHSSVGRWLSLGCEGPRVRIGGLGRRFPGQSSRVWWGSWCSLSAL
ncbi:hypothetical protein Bca101_096206 [Brassica carinata]